MLFNSKSINQDVNVMFLGSCLSSLTISELVKREEFNLISSFTHLRSDFALKLFEE